MGGAVVKKLACWPGGWEGEAGLRIDSQRCVGGKEGMGVRMVVGRDRRVTCCACWPGGRGGGEGCLEGV